jgi:hypothetical protein
MNSVKEDVKFAGQLSLCGESLKRAVEIYADMLDSGYQPTNYVTAGRFLDMMLEASKELTEIMKNHAVVIQAHTELGKM